MSIQTSAEIRSQLIEALQLDLIGPRPTDSLYQTEILDLAPSKWYLTGFLVPYEADLNQRSDDASNEDPDQLDASSVGDDDNTPEAASARKAIFPSSIGLSFLVSPACKTLTVTVDWGDYLTPDETDTAESRLQALSSRQWQRQPQQVSLEISIPAQQKNKCQPIPHSGGLELALSVQPVTAHALLPPGTRAVSLFLVNQRRPAEDAKRDEAYVFQAQLSITSTIPFIPRPDMRGQNIKDEDERIADLQYRADVEYAVGHNISAMALLDQVQCYQIQTTWMPSADVEKVVAADIPGINLEMAALGNATDGAAIRQMVGGIVTEYSTWIVQQQAQSPTSPPQRAEVAKDLLHRAAKVNERIQAGLQALDDPKVLAAFKIANRAIERAIRQRSIHGKEGALPEAIKPPKWRPFQLAFLLMNMAGIVQPTHPDREVVDLLFFPTGGGKTEAYLGLAAFTLVLRRLNNPGLQSAGLSVLMRYTLRLLTLDQLSRAATLICALELERQQDVEKLGKWPFEIGLWVGQSATPNKMGKKGDNNPDTARARTIKYQNQSSKDCPIPLDECPWCGTRFNSSSFQLLPKSDQPKDLRITCANIKKRPDGQPVCVFRRDQSLPIIAVDEPIYRRLPCFLIATVDKFANLPWVGETGALFGRVSHFDTDGFYGPTSLGQGQPLADRLPPPDLIIQDELHLISGPLGTMVGLYETALETLASIEQEGQTIRPKIIASTATVRRATSQIRALFGREFVEVFPPPGPDRRDAFFAKTVLTSEAHARIYVGIAAQGRSLKVLLLRSYRTLLAAAQKAWQDCGGATNPSNPADPYMTLLGYFNSLRELGGSRRIVEDEVKASLANYGKRQRVNEPASLFADRSIADEPVELTSRVSTSEVAQAKGRISQTYLPKTGVDVVLATNMISVGLDITRLGLMVVLGQPKTSAEYIQCTSRVGRDDQRPGLVITLLNVHRPRDRSHYERFQVWHQTFYRAVEATSVTPFSPRALDRGLAGVVVALSRLGVGELTAPRNAAEIIQHRPTLDFVVDVLAQRAEKHHKDLDARTAESQRQTLSDRTNQLLDSWKQIALDKDGLLQYQQETGKAPPLLYDPLDPELNKQPRIAQNFKAQRSLRDVEPTVNLWVKTLDGLDVEDEV
jgi:hypothetical protein